MGIVGTKSPETAPLRTSFAKASFPSPMEGAWTVSRPAADQVVFRAENDQVAVEKRYKLAGPLPAGPGGGGREPRQRRRRGDAGPAPVQLAGPREDGQRLLGRQLGQPGHGGLRAQRGRQRAHHRREGVQGAQGVHGAGALGRGRRQVLRHRRGARPGGGAGGHQPQVRPAGHRPPDRRGDAGVRPADHRRRRQDQLHADGVRRAEVHRGAEQGPAGRPERRAGQGRGRHLQRCCPGRCCAC